MRKNIGPALWIGDRVTGFNRFTEEAVAGELVELSIGFDGVQYAVVKTRDGEQSIEARALFGPRACNKPSRGGDYRNNVCVNCGRTIFPNGPYDTDRLTHKLESVHPRYR